MAGIQPTKTQAFAHFGAKATNVRWGWSARSDDGATVVLTVWDDDFDADAPVAVLDRFHHKNLALWCDAPGNKDRIRNLIWARDQCGGLFRIVVATARDVDAYPRLARSFRPHARVMKLTALDETTGEFRAVGV